MPNRSPLDRYSLRTTTTILGSLTTIALFYASHRYGSVGDQYIQVADSYRAAGKMAIGFTHDSLATRNHVVAVALRSAGSLVGASTIAVCIDSWAAVRTEPTEP